jgi:uncharacterized protein YydD (DUF2326 family)
MLRARVLTSRAADSLRAIDGQLKKDYKQLIELNRAITDERRTELIKQRADAEEAISRVETELAELNDRRSESLAFLRETHSLEKYKQTSRELTKLQAELGVLEQRREAASGLAELRRKVRTLSQGFDQLQTVVEDELDELSQDDDSRFGEIRRYFADIVAAVIGEQAILSMTLNKSGGVEFRAEPSSVRTRRLSRPRTSCSHCTIRAKMASCSKCRRGR